MHIEKRRQQHIASYTSAEQQAADIFHARHYPEHFAKLEKLLAEKYPDLPEQARQGIFNNARLSIGLTSSGRDDYSQKGNTRFYGLPDLPSEIEYPRFYEKEQYADDEDYANATCYRFVAQINLADLKGMCDYLPEQGILYFFLQTQYGFANNHESRVYYYNGALENLRSAKDLSIKPEDIDDIASEYSSDALEPTRVEVEPFVCILHNDYHEKLAEKKVKNLEIAALYPPEIYDAPIEAINATLQGRSGGIGNGSINSNIEVLNPWGNSNGCDGSSPYYMAAKAFGGEPQDYIVLLQSNPDIALHGFVYGSGCDMDNDNVYFMIHKDRLKNRDFSQIYCSVTWWWRQFF